MHLPHSGFIHCADQREVRLNFREIWTQCGKEHDNNTNKENFETQQEQETTLKQQAKKRKAQKTTKHGAVYAVWAVAVKRKQETGER